MSLVVHGDSHASPAAQWPSSLNARRGPSSVNANADRMKAFGTELYLKMRRCLKTLEEENA